MAKPKDAKAGDPVEARLDEIYGQPPENFTAARNELAAELKRSGEPERAKEVRALKRPTRPAWAVNRLALEHPRPLRELRDAAARLRSVDPADGRELRDAAASQRDAITVLVELARDELGGAKGASGVLDRVTETLHAVAGDEEVEALVARGRLERERRLATLGALGSPAAEPAAKQAKPKGKGKGKDENKGEARRRDRLNAARVRRRELAGRMREAEEAERAAERRLADAESAAAEARDRRDRAAAERERLAARLATAEEKLAQLGG